MNRAVLVTGANGGLGQALCTEFRAAGWWVIGSDLAAAPALAGPYVPADLERLAVDAAARAALRKAVLRECAGRPLKALVNNAAVQLLGSAETLTAEDLARSLAVNVIAPCLLGQLFLPELAAAKGSIVNIGSIHARATKPGFVSYATSKAALAGLTRAMAVDLGGRVRVNLVQPAAIATEMLAAGFAGQPAAMAELARCHPAGRIGEPGEIARAALFLASDDCAFMTGATLDVDGGIGARLHDPN